MNTKYKDLIEQTFDFPQEEFKTTNGDLFFHNIDLLQLVKKYGTPKQLKRYELLKPEDVEFVASFVKKEVKLPPEFVPLSMVSDGMKLTHHYKQAVAYLKKRNITDKIVRKFNIGFCFGGPYENRIIIPSYDEHRRINYFIALIHFEIDDKKQPRDSCLY